jgi:hypothetical protein
VGEAKSEALMRDVGESIGDLRKKMVRLQDQLHREQQYVRVRQVAQALSYLSSLELQVDLYDSRG